MTALAFVLVVAVIGLAFVVNHAQARVGVVEVMLNEGLPPGSTRSAATSRQLSDTSRTARLSLTPGVHLYLSRSCHACRRLMAELAETSTTITEPLHLHLVDRPLSGDRTLAQQLGATIDKTDADVLVALGADPLPYAVARGPHGLAAGAPVPTAETLRLVAADAGLRLLAT